MEQSLKGRLQDVFGLLDESEYTFIQKLKDIVNEYELSNLPIKEAKPISEIILESIKTLEDPKNVSNNIESGFKGIDNSIGGFTPGELVVIGGRPGMGKTQLMVNLALNISLAHPVIYFSFDLTEFLLTYRFISCLTSIPTSVILQGKISEEEMQRIAAVQNKILAHQILIHDAQNSSIALFKAHCIKYIKEYGVKVIMIDYIQMLSSDKYKKYREAEIADILRELKRIAKENNVCIIASSLLSRAVETRGGDKKPMLSDLRESGAIEQDADKVIFIYRPEYYCLTTDENGRSTTNQVELIVAKNKNGPLANINLLKNSCFSSLIDDNSSNESFDFSQERVNEIS